MNVWVTDLLAKAGVDPSRIAWSVTAGEDELDIMAEFLGLRVFFELKDREFGLGDAYTFAARVARYGGDCGVVITTDKVGEETLNFLTEERQTDSIGVPIEVIQGQDTIASQITGLIDRLSRTAIKGLIMDYSEPLGINLALFLEAWMNERGAEWISTPLALPAPELACRKP